MFSRPSGANATHGKNLSPKLSKVMKSKLQHGPPFQVALETVASVVLKPWICETLAVLPFCVVASSFAHTTTKAWPPWSAGLGSPARLGKLLQRNVVPLLAVLRSHTLPVLPVEVVLMPV